MELKIENLSKSYKTKPALKNVSFTLREGIYGLLGENGAGKSTLMRILATIDFQTTGRVTYNGQEIAKLDEEYRDVLGYMPQDYDVFLKYTAQDFLEYIGALKGIGGKRLKQKIQAVLEFVNLSEAANKKVKNFSGGMKRRLGIAQAILNDPALLILDEPTAGLDPKERIRFANIISEMAENKIVLLSTHIISDIEAIANRLIIIQNGELLKTGDIGNLIETVRGRVFEAVVDPPAFQLLLQERKVVRRKQEGDRIRVRYVGEKYGDAAGTAPEPCLEDYYVSECL